MLNKFEQKKSEGIAEDLLGMKFVIGGRGQNKEIDCYGVLVHYYKQFGIDLPDYSYQDDWGENEELVLKEYASFFKKLNKIEKPKVGDMIVFLNSYKSASHLGVYIGDGRFVHSYMKIGVKVDSLTNKAWKDKIYGIFRMKDID